MKSFTLKLLLLTAILVGGVVWIVLHLNVRIPAEYWVREIALLKKHFAEAEDEPKIVFIGGSNILFGIDASQVQQALGIPSYNLGLHAGLRLQTHLEGARAVAKPGDTIILMLEPSYWHAASEKWSSWQLRNAIAWDRSILPEESWWNKLVIYSGAFSKEIYTDIHTTLCDYTFHRDRVPPPLKNRESILTEFEKRVASSTDQDWNGSYIDMCANRNGDIFEAKGRNYKGKAVALITPGGISKYSHKLLTDFLIEMKGENVRVYFANIPYISEAETAVGAAEIDAEFSKKIQDLGSTLIDSRMDLVFPREMFYDTVFHLNRDGRAKRSELIVEAIRRHVLTDHPFKHSNDPPGELPVMVE